ncbi:alcohol dehydrogenase [Saccharolobus solfataricus]|uniref:Alcohol dehydrogenase (Zn containing) (Adh-11) n=3 Tax=Saccharolobus solfataricus TaxID=2287 RepID=Q97VB8_SACS2|nr:zinc-binding dehydrogenase [Saccharolobus solfataricus]AAK42827.1 Alcohol dehydrogenase (Zn containing) (adh-11) [Saccharolobus solfataricus P2]AKA72922.1 alcohol dehydrogenase [Saccharolobus solfataricus]AKA75621.1 alcohol dehydrogenase [Saccharolobus solfataricus]AKA78314.1 alcohol dehydrogenase [Saccharolobus solfataricus]AZF67433.1 alcohol dehydrogenase [Saccharolobus solfataricus]
MWKVFFINGNFVKENVRDELPKPNEVKVFPKYIGICGTDKNIYLGKKPVKEPLVLGHEISGITEKGEKVAIFPNYWCGYCNNCRRGFYNSCKNKISIGVNADGGMAEYINVPKDFVFRIPYTLDLKLGALVEPTAVAVAALNKIDKEIEKVIIIGGGSTGTLVSIVAEINGLETFVIEKDSRKEEILKEKGFRTTKELKFDDRVAVIDTINNQESMVLAQSILKNSIARSELIITGLDNEQISLNRDIIVRNEVIIRGSIIYSKDDFLNSIKIVSENQEKFNKIVDKVGYIDNINEWFRKYVIELPNIKVLIKMDSI